MQDRILSEIEVHSVSSEGKGIGRYENKVIFIDKAVPGDLVDVRIFKKKSSFEEGRIERLIRASSLRTGPACQHFGLCGGCVWQHIDYPAQLKLKQEMVKNNLERIGKIQLPEIPEVLGSEKVYGYRNKLDFTFSAKRWLTAEYLPQADQIDRRGLGFHLPGAFDKVLDIQKCHHQADLSNDIRNAIRAFSFDRGWPYFDLKEQQGLMRNLIIRCSSIGEWMVLISFFRNDQKEIAELMEYLKQSFPQITSLLYVVNEKKNETIFDQEIICYSGRDYILERLGNKQFRIGPKSFFQTNSYQAGRLYEVIKDFADMQGTETLYDLYCGVGSIGIYLSDQAAQVIGIEEVAAAIEDAKRNAELNKLSNIHFYSGDVRKLMNEVLIQKHGAADVIVTDPPRAGMHEEAIRFLAESGAAKIVYVSCNVATQARDLQLLDAQYEVKRLQPVDMFPHTAHIENVALLVKR